MIWQWKFDDISIDELFLIYMSELITFYKKFAKLCISSISNLQAGVCKHRCIEYGLGESGRLQVPILHLSFITEQRLYRF